MAQAWVAFNAKQCGSVAQRACHAEALDYLSDADVAFQQPPLKQRQAACKADAHRADVMMLPCRSHSRMLDFDAGFNDKSEPERSHSRQERRAQSVHVLASSELFQLSPEVRRRIQQHPGDAMLRFLPRVLAELG